MNKVVDGCFIFFLFNLRQINKKLIFLLFENIQHLTLIHLLAQASPIFKKIIIGK
jgi:hypothetical protein